MSSESHETGPTGVKLLNTTIGRLFQETCGQRGIQEALVCPQENVQLTFMQLKNEVEKVAAGLLACGLERGDRLLLWGANHANFVVVTLACARAGIVFGSISPTLPPNAVLKALKQGGFRAVLAFPSQKAGAAYQTLSNLCPELQNATKGELKTKTLPTLTHVIIDEDDHKYPGTFTLTEIVGMAKPEFVAKLTEIQKDLKTDDLASIQFTSGTTGAPKAVMLSHFQMINSCHIAGKRMGFVNAGEILCCQMPVFRGPILTLSIIGSSVFGFKLVFPAPLSLPPAIFKTIQDQKCTSILSNAVAFHLMLRLPISKKFNLDSLKTAYLLGEHIPTDLIAALENSTTISKVHTGLLYTELCCTPVVSPTGAPFENLISKQGTILDHYEAKLVDIDGKTVGRGEIGELMIRVLSNKPFLGYYNDEIATSEKFFENWFKTGDVGTMDSDGNLNALGQKEDIIRHVGGNKTVMPWPIEKCLTNHTAVLGAQVVGIACSPKESKVCACVVVKSKEENALDLDGLRKELNQLCRDEKVEEPSFVIFMPEFPKTAARKVQKFKLRETVRDLIKEQYGDKALK